MQFCTDSRARATQNAFKLITLFAAILNAYVSRLNTITLSLANRKQKFICISWVKLRDCECVCV